MDEMGIGDRQWQIGRSKIFLRSGAHATLEEHRARIIGTQTICIQTVEFHPHYLYVFY